MAYSADSGFLLSIYNPFHKWHNDAMRYYNNADGKGDKVLIVWKAKEEFKNVIRKKIVATITAIIKFAHLAKTLLGDHEQMLDDYAKTFSGNQKNFDYNFFSFIKVHFAFSATDLLDKDKLNLLLQRLDNMQLSVKDIIDDFVRLKSALQEEMHFVYDSDFRNMVYDVINDMYADVLGFHKDDDHFVAENICLAIKKSMPITILTSDSVMNFVINSQGFKEYSQAKHFELGSILFMS